VLAPISYYRDYDLTTLNSALNRGLAEFGEGKGVPLGLVSLGFEFCELGADTVANLGSESVRSAIGSRRAIWVAE